MKTKENRGRVYHRTSFPCTYRGSPGALDQRRVFGSLRISSQLDVEEELGGKLLS